MNNNTVKLENDVEIYENKISEYLDQYIVEKNIEDMSREPQSRWNAALIYIYKNIFKEHKDSLKGPDAIESSWERGRVILLNMETLFYQSKGMYILKQKTVIHRKILSVNF